MRIAKDIALSCATKLITVQYIKPRISSSDKLQHVKAFKTLKVNKLRPHRMKLCYLPFILTNNDLNYSLKTHKDPSVHESIVSSKMKVKITKWNAVATWRWDIPDDDVCGICQVHFDGTCPTCKYPGDDCSLCKNKSR